MDFNNQIELELYFADHFDTILFPLLANLYLEQDDLKRARKVCQIGLRHHENNAEGLFTLAKIEKAEGNLKDAEKCLEKVLLYSNDHLAASEMLCEIQTVLGRASSRLLKSWQFVLLLDPENKTANAFVKKVEKELKKKPKKKRTKLRTQKKNKQPTKNVITIKERSQKGKKESMDYTKDEIREPLKVSSRLATFTLVAVLKNQGLYDQALEVLDALEKKGEKPDIIKRERKSIQAIIKDAKRNN